MGKYHWLLYLTIRGLSLQIISAIKLSAKRTLRMIRLQYPRRFCLNSAHALPEGELEGELEGVGNAGLTAWKFSGLIFLSV
jgi:hypothetical protein